jgi:hypothetical protein
MENLALQTLMDKWVSDWVYETDLLLVHKSGFAVQFYGDEPREDACGDIVPGSAAGHTKLMEQWAREPNAAELLQVRPLQQAMILYRNRPADTLGAPRRLVKSTAHSSRSSG